jgi:hypothetical protein
VAWVRRKIEMPTIGDPNGAINRQAPPRPKPYYGGEQVSETEQADSSHRSGSFLLAALMWLAYTASAFMVMLGVILPTWGNVFIVLTFLIVAAMASWSGGKVND